MISIAEAVRIVKANIPSQSVREIPLEEAIGSCLAGEVRAPEPSPRYTNSAMDGFGVRWEDVAGAASDSPVPLRIVGESRAGLPFGGKVARGEAVRISTGAMLAAGCDTVVRVEDTSETDGDVHVLTVRKQGQDVRYQGEEFQEGDLLLAAGTRISAPQAALLASVGVTGVVVFKPCRVAVLVTGSELVSSGEKIAGHQIRDSNMIMLTAAVREAGGEVVSRIRVADDERSTREAIGQAEADIILCAGGVSVGRHDHVKAEAEAEGFAPLFWRVRQKPGKPLYFARKGDTLLFGLPGNPVSAFMCFAHYVRPVIGALNGLPFAWPAVAGRAATDIANRGKRTNMIRVRLSRRPDGSCSVIKAEKQGSHMLTSIAHADGYIVLDPGCTLKEGERCEVYLYDFHRI